MRAAIYARYSSELQHDRSIDDQVRLCREHAARLGADVVAVFADYAISGGTLKNRPEANRLLNDARTGAFDTVIAEALDRLSRDQEDIAAIHKRLQFAGIRLFTVSEGECSELHIGLKGTMNALFLRELALKIRRGQTGRAAAGSSPGGLSYGYEVVRELDARGEPIRGRRRVSETQAAVIRRIFHDYAAGHSPRAIAHDLNRDGITPPRGSKWNTSTIFGSARRKNGILHNEAYIGLLIYNRMTMIKDPDTGKRLSRPNDPSLWVITEVPELRIIDDETWNRAHELKRKISRLPRPEQARRPRHLLSGLVRCGVCGGAYTVRSRDQLGCSTHRESGTCTNGRTVRVADLTNRVLGGVKNQLLSPERLTLFVKTYQDERRSLREQASQDRGELSARLSKATRQIENIVDAIAEGVASPSMKERLKTLEADRSRLESEIARVDELTQTNVIELHPGALDDYRRRLDALTSAPTDGARDPDETQAVAALRGLIAAVVVYPGEKRGDVDVRVQGLIEALYTPNVTPPVAMPRFKRPSDGRTATMVAEEGFEPPTQGL